MAPTIPTIEPTSARAGDSWLWTAGGSFASYPATDGWALTYELRGAQKITLGSIAGEVTANGTGWDVVVPASRTAGFSADSCQFAAVLTGSGTYAGRIHQVALPDLELLPSLVLAGAGDMVEWARTQLANVNKAIASRIAGDEPEGYTIDGEQVVRIPLEKLFALRIRFSNEINQAVNPQSFGRRVDTAFVTTGARSSSFWT